MCTFRCVLAQKSFNFASSLEWGRQACAAFESATGTQMLDLQLVFAGSRLYDALRRQGETTLIQPLRLVLEEHGHVRHPPPRPCAACSVCRMFVDMCACVCVIWDIRCLSCVPLCLIRDIRCLSCVRMCPLPAVAHLCLLRV